MHACNDYSGVFRKAVSPISSRCILQNLFAQSYYTNLCQLIEPGKQLVQHLHQLLGGICRRDSGESYDVRVQNTAKQKESSVMCFMYVLNFLTTNFLQTFS